MVRRRLYGVEYLSLIHISKNGGNGWGFVPDVFLAYLAERGVDKTIIKKLCIDNPGRLLTA